jgi:hypothetical protein
MIAPDKTGDEKSVEEWELDATERLGETGIFMPEDGTPDELVGKIMAALGFAATLGCATYSIMDRDSVSNLKKELYLGMVILLERLIQDDD